MTKQKPSSPAAKPLKQKRSYRQFCGVAKALDLIGGRWTLLIARNLLLGPLRYTDLMATLPGITTNLLAQRLDELTGAGLLERRRLPPPSSSDVYALTEEGRRLEPVVMALGRFGSAYLTQPAPEDFVHPRNLMVSYMRCFHGAARAAVLELRVDDLVFRAALTPESLVIRAGDAPDATATLTGSLRAFAALVQGAQLSQLIGAGLLSSGGDPDAAESLAGALRLA